MSTANDEAIEAWDGVLFDRFSQFRHIIVPGLSAHSDVALRRNPPPTGGRVLDIGCGFGDTTRQLAELVGPEGHATGVDAAPRFVAAAWTEAAAAGATNVTFKVADVQRVPLGGPFDYAFSRCGTMFFANPVAALRNVREALTPGAPLTMVVWRRKLDNPWLQRAEVAVERFVEQDENSDEPTCGPGPFSMADADTTSDILLSAGFEQVEFARSDIVMRIGRDLDEATAYVMALGPAAEIIRLAGDEGERLRPQIAAAVGAELADYAEPGGVHAQMSTWIVTARNPASG